MVASVEWEGLEPSLPSLAGWWVLPPLGKGIIPAVDDLGAPIPCFGTIRVFVQK